ncbi:SapC protein [Mesorhizobium albiziae]|uniref:SapC protein n=1 Tax=Neomesorhizobium albiziae TaxID=335020 RepID=A0A1I4E463_9HYPH|nr:SapC family protein [Mesorhizobium albiziae]GLS32472.1 SapC family protein [Mesorhizobium albiziae]SFL00552.1 SapC protein [Mesorhizobium albiziae]
MADNNRNTARNGDTAGAPSPQLPIFYTAPEALNPKRHGTLSLVLKSDFRFAASAYAIPIVASEMPAAMRSYPIVFIGPEKMPVVVTGLRQDENLFVEPDGSWSAPHYVPAYVRRYPFVMAEDAEQTGRLTLCVDRGSDRLIETPATPPADGEAVSVPLFKGSEPADATRKALEFCKQFQLGFAATRAMIERIDALGLFSARRSTVTLDSGEVLNLSDFQVVDESALNALGDSNFLDLRTSGALAMIYCHLASSNSWNALAHQAQVRN